MAEKAEAISRRPKVLITHSGKPDSQDSAKVLALEESLKRDGIDCEVDPYRESSPKKLRQWIKLQIQERMYGSGELISIIVICIEEVARELFDFITSQSEVIIVVLSPQTATKIPHITIGRYYRLFNINDYYLDKSGDYKQLHRYLLNPEVISEVGEWLAQDNLTALIPPK